MRGSLTMWRRLSDPRARSGIAALEFGLLTPLFLILLAAVVDFANAYTAKSLLDATVASAANYVLLNASNPNSTTIGTNAANLIGNSKDASGFGSTDLLNVDPRLAALQDNGGPTFTMALLPGSPAIDAGDNTDAPEFDQRGSGFPRIVGGTIDIGAFEVQPGPATRFQVSTPAHITSNTPFDVTVTALDAYGHTAVGYLGTVTFGATDTDPGVLLPADYTFTADDQGVHPFVGAFVLITLGDQTLTATDTADQTITGSASVAVIPGPTPPPGGSANGPRNPTVITDRTPVQSGQQVALVDRLFASINGKESGFIVAGELSPEKYPVTIY